jgi:hypothetical protein
MSRFDEFEFDDFEAEFEDVRKEFPEIDKKFNDFWRVVVIKEKK